MTGDAKDTESVRRTIVGGRPMDRRRRKVQIPIGIEKVLCAAAANQEFCEQLVMARGAALAGTSLAVSPAEAAILGSVSEDALRTMIANIDLKRHRRRRFFRGIAAASLAATTALAGCDEARVQDHSDAAALGENIVDVQYNLTDLGATDTPPDEIDVANVFYDVGNTADNPDVSDPGCYVPMDPPCEVHEDCPDGLICVPFSEEMVCSCQCLEDCPQGLVCQMVDNGGDPIFVCLPPTDKD